MGLTGTVEDLSHESSIHGLNHVYQRPSTSWKCFWMLLTIGGVGAASYGTINILIRWGNNPVASEIHVYSRDSMKLPHVIIMTKNVLNPTKLAQYNISQSLQDIFQSYSAELSSIALFKTDVFHQISEQTWQDARKEYQDLLEATSSENIDDLLQKLALKCEDVVVGCSLNSIEFDCCIGYPKQQYYFYSGFALATGNQIQQGIGLDIQLSGNNFEGQDFFAPFSSTAISLISGFDSSNNDVQKLIHIAWGKASVISLASTIIESENNPPNYVCNQNAQYSLQKCKNDCVAKLLLDVDRVCNCSDPRGAKMHDHYCDPWEWRRCSAASMSTGKQVNQVSNCLTNACPRECTQHKVTDSIQVVDFNPALMAKGWKISISDAKKKIKTTALIRLMYTSMEDIVVRQYFAMTFDSALSEIGGQIGLFLGASLITLAHLIVFCMERVADLSCIKGPKKVAPKK